jgi:hypothetical protein
MKLGCKIAIIVSLALPTLLAPVVAQQGITRTPLGTTIFHPAISP